MAEMLRKKRLCQKFFYVREKSPKEDKNEKKVSNYKNQKIWKKRFLCARKTEKTRKETGVLGDENLCKRIS